MIIEGLKEKLVKMLRLDNLLENLSGYLEARMELFKVEIREDLARTLSRAIVYIGIGFCGFMLLVFFSIGFALFLHRYFEDEYVGYMIVAGLYAIVFFLFFIFRKDLDKRFEKQFMEAIKRKNK
jgi:uncharacterized membrane protein YqjE